MKPVTVHEDAEKELREALDYYAQQRFGLDNKLLHEFETAVARVCHNPWLYAAEEDDGVRYCPFRLFPYNLVYLDLEDRIWVVAVMHQKRRPRYWAKRLAE